MVLCYSVIPSVCPTPKRQPASAEFHCKRPADTPRRRSTRYPSSLTLCDTISWSPAHCYCVPIIFSVIFIYFFLEQGGCFLRQEIQYYNLITRNRGFCPRRRVRTSAAPYRVRRSAEPNTEPHSRLLAKNRHFTKIAFRLHPDEYAFTKRVRAYTAITCPWCFSIPQYISVVERVSYGMRYTNNGQSTYSSIWNTVKWVG